jgi:myosin heavy subunit
MKNYAFIAAAALLLSACGGGKEEAVKVSAERDSLMSVINQRDSSINEFLAVNSEIETNLDSIVARERTINTSMQKNVETNASAKERINADIQAINDLMKANRKKINELNRKLKNSNAKNAAYEKMIEMLNERLAAKDKELEELNRQLAEMHAKVEHLETSVNTLTAENTEKEQTIQQQTTELHTAYYVVGKSKELRDKKIIDKTGGLLGIGKTSVLEPNASNTSFTQIDYTKVTDINVNNKHAKFVTSHPTDSYMLNKDSVTKIITIKITDPARFWSASKYLVVVTD